MRNRSQASSTARKKQLKVQHHKMNSRRQCFYNQIANQPENQEFAIKLKEN